MMDSFRNRLLILFASLSFILGLFSTLYLGKMASMELTQASGELLHATAKSMSNTLAHSLDEREREIMLLSQSPFFMESDFRDPKLQLKLDQVKASYKYYAWIGIADLSGKVIVAGDELLQGLDVSDRPWFSRGLRQIYLGDVHKAVLLAKKIKSINPNEPLRFIDFASPIYDITGNNVRGVLAAHADWSWASQILTNAMPEDAKQKGVEVFIVNQQGDLLYPYKSIGQVRPPYIQHKANYFIDDWQEQKKYLTSVVSVVSDTNMDLGWRVIIRQPIDLALAEVYQLKKNMVIFGVFISLILLFVTYRLANRFSQPIEMLDETARAVEQGREDINFSQSTSIVEIKSLSESLESMTETLRSQKKQLLEINATLENKVQIRTQALETANLELEKLACQDGLTGLHNRRALNEYINYLFSQLANTHQAYAVLLLDVDYFKKVNDTYGHEVGDRVLQDIARILSYGVRATDFVARFGGEEFMIILPATPIQNAEHLADRVRRVVEQAELLENHLITISIGISVAALQDQDIHDAIRRADKALYTAKQEGRNRVVSKE